MTRQKIDFSYEISDERLLAYSRMPIIDRLRWLDEIRRFTLMMREAPTVEHRENAGSTDTKLSAD